MIGRLIHAGIGWPIFALVTVLLPGMGVVLQLLALPFDPGRRVSWRALHWGWGHVLWFAIPFWRTRRLGAVEASEGPFIVVANHASILDVPLLYGLPFPLAVVARSRIFDTPILGPLMRLSGQIPLHLQSDERGTELVRDCQRALESGTSLVLFPEGTRSTDGSMGTFHRGAFRIAKDLDIPVLPVVIDGTASILPKGKRSPDGFTAKVTMAVLDPVQPAGYSTARRMSNEVHRRMSAALAQHREAT